MTLEQVPECTKVKILSIRDSIIRNRILGLGIVPGCIVEVIRTSPLGDPRMYKVFNKMVSLRNSEAKIIEVSLIDESIPLIFASDGEYEVVELCGGRMFRRKMELLGVYVGKEISVINGNIKLNDEVINMGDGMKKKIILRRL
ncbi:iron transporter FeoA [Thermosipho melanesiensis]|uniref:FeoA family protein n=2 Tax=Thermosipho melanesiensis TaxID=46541 RepID=A6LNS8_THEM4|nr:FeoA family protein [Thermosipho melanesiensis]ABR31579.1 FeoA family protein [Thermosipho melanesiensis BI429]APT74612.1 iron transporter FeoA [Thermosipho melanesiensis]OOC35315.1 iron transporter FeoA [Thermosipho melanesiensis]OOC35533.1 iron transporter FeoA [Thermosipho melanesiensis]OOC36570.1 iron transporter FeoA [Thermosipho melanesiensis]